MKDNLIYKSNEIIEASYTLTLNEQRLLLACISQVNSAGEIKDSYVISVEQARDLFYSKRVKDQAYRDLKRASEHLYERKIKMQSEDGKRTRWTRWVSTVDFDDGEQTATLHFHDQIKPYISQLKVNFTKYRLRHVTQLTSVYAIRVYELIVSWYAQSQPYKEMTIDEFKDLLQLGEKYKQFGQLKERVISPALEQINEFTDFELEISYRKVGRTFKYVQLRYQQSAHAQFNESQRSVNFKKREEKRISSEKKHVVDKKKADFAEFAKKIEIKAGQRLLDKTTGIIHTVNDADGINLTPAKPIYDQEIKRLIYSGRFIQVTNEGDTSTLPIQLD